MAPDSHTYPDFDKNILNSSPSLTYSIGSGSSYNSSNYYLSLPVKPHSYTTLSAVIAIDLDLQAATSKTYFFPEKNGTILGSRIGFSVGNPSTCPWMLKPQAYKSLPPLHPSFPRHLSLIISTQQHPETIAKVWKSPTAT